ncbi:MAG: hypothetical protein IJ593_00330 [Lachnospiraceae bacterium]|nr:hypothetical protein [Lachnospiraceae bacterium]
MKGFIKAICILLMLYGVQKVSIEIVKAGSIIHKVKDAMNEATVYVANENYDDIYKSLRDGYTGGYKTEAKYIFRDHRDYADIVTRLVDILDVETDGSEFIKNENDVEYYKFYDVDVKITNTGLLQQKKFYNIDMYLVLEIPMQISKISIPLKVNLHSKAEWHPKYDYEDLRKFH